MVAIFKNFNYLKFSGTISKRFKFSKPEIHALLLEDVPGLGERGDIVTATVNLMRNYLVPANKAYYIPRFKGKPILPDNWSPPVSRKNLNLETITPAVEYVPYTEFKGSKDSSIDEDGISFLTNEEQKQKLRDLKLSFKRVLVASDENKIFGSVSSADIQSSLELHGISIPKDNIQCRLKTIGNHSISITIGNEIIQLPVEVTTE